ncbi:extracellular solute-binding protein [Photobacterium sp. ZSDE20]|uniref:Extracellular solute-binding protein n=1 Tax=Photobacterium pectinilyticum TaxID=2906793 RepID=A0ABT1N6D6_9GAMM|nr:extracellular solute-binding protein [Photobacterium sp. ZSDE20]MCQ1060305.1 extracellular solute-binding protein [Photobacterium sp. ZSDE20]MDD1827603.1 extracellular solute-binding protein [Photobacterium sp. ZSDE20]
MMKKQLLTLMTTLALSSGVHANCDLSGYEAQGELSLLSNSYAVLKYFSDKMAECESESLKINNKLVSGSAVQEQARIILSSRRGNSPYDLIQVSAESFHEFQAKEQIQPITDLIEKFWDEYELSDIPNEIWDLATIDGEIFAVPLQMNMQQFFYREDILNKYDLSVPKTYADVIANAEVLQQQGIKYPISQAMGKGWDLATEFTNIYLSLGGEYFDLEGKPLFNSDKGVKAAETLKSLLSYMSPNALSMSSDLAMVNFQQDKAVMGNIWATRAAEMDDAEVSKVVGKVQYTGAPTATSKVSIPSTSIFWDGYVMPKRVGENRELIFKVLMEMLKKESMAGASHLAFLTRKSASDVEGEQYRYLNAMRDMVESGAKAFPNQPYYSLAHNEIGSKLPDALRGKKDIKLVLNDAARAYYKEAKAQGFLE